MITPNRTQPYDLVQGHQPCAFVTFETPHYQESWPWHLLQVIRLNADQSLLSFEFPRHTVELAGENLGVIEMEARLTRLKSVRAGTGSTVTVKTVRILPC